MRIPPPLISQLVVVVKDHRLVLQEAVVQRRISFPTLDALKVRRRGGKEEEEVGGAG